MRSTVALTIRVTLSLVVFYVVLLLLIFNSAGTVRFVNGWVYFGIFFFATNILTFYFLWKDPPLIDRRTKTEHEPVQIVIQAINGLMFFLLLVIPSLDFKHHWTSVPQWLTVVSHVMVAIGFVIVFFVFQQNSFVSSNIHVYDQQTVSVKGLYSLVRHPMYSGAYLIVLFTSTALGSYLGLFPAVVISVLIVLRTINEEKILSRDLDGYKKYSKTVRYRYFPYLW